MRNIKSLFICSVFLVSQFIPVVFAGAPNTSAGAAAPYVIGQGWVTHLFDENTQTRWFTYEEEGGHSYCLEAVQGPISPVALDPTITAYTSSAGTTVLTSMVSNAQVQSTSAAGNPNRVKGARVCYIAPATGGTKVVRTFKVNAPVGTGDAGFLRVRVVDTSIYLSPFKIARSNYPDYQGPYPGCFLNLAVENISTSSIRIRASLPAAGAVNWGLTATLEPSTAPQQNFALSQYAYSTWVPTTVDPQTNETQFTFGEVRGIFFIAHDGSPGMIQARAWQRIDGLTVGCASAFVPPNSIVDLIPFGKW
jgi:hypothetical protein